MERNTFERKLLERMESAVRSESFANIQTRLSSKAWTLSAEREGLRVLVHATLGDQPPRASASVDLLKSRDIRLKASVPTQAIVQGEEAGRAIGGAAGTTRRNVKRPPVSRKIRRARAPAAKKSRSRR